eukprot:g39075.t1
MRRNFFSDMVVKLWNLQMAVEAKSLSVFRTEVDRWYPIQLASYAPGSLLLSTLTSHFHLLSYTEHIKLLTIMIDLRISDSKHIVGTADAGESETSFLKKGLGPKRQPSCS